MSTKYRDPKHVPSEALIARLNELADAITRGGESKEGELTMRVPAECDRDADLVISEAARRLEKAEARVKDLSKFIRAGDRVCCELESWLATEHDKESQRAINIWKKLRRQAEEAESPGGEQ